MDDVGYSGKLDIASLELERIPEKVYISLLGLSATDLSNPLPPQSPSRESMAASGARPAIGASPFAVDEEEDSSRRDSVSGTWRREEDIWSEPEELTTLRLGNNKLVEIDREIGMFGGLKILDVCNSQYFSLVCALICTLAKQKSSQKDSRCPF